MNGKVTCWKQNGKARSTVGATLETAKLRFLFSFKVFELAKDGVVKD